MFRHSLLIIYRNFKRFKSTFLINLIGLSTGMACALLIYLWVNDELSVDKFHKNDSQLFQVIERVKTNGGVEISEHTTGILSEALAKEMPEVELAASARDGDKYTLSVGTNNLKAVGIYASKDYFNMFTYNLLEGDKNQILADRSSIVISEDLAKRLFNTSKGVIGKTIEVEHKSQYQITGIFKGTPANSSVQFDFAVSFELYKAVNPNASDWKYTTTLSYVMLKKGANVASFNNKIAGLIEKRSGDSTRSLFVRPYSEAYLHGKYENGVQTGGRIEYVKLFSIIAIFILTIACINFMNLSTAKASGRIKEVGIKKTLGARRETLIFQYLGESMLMAFLSLLVAAILVLLLLPSFNEITGKHLTLRIGATSIASFLGITIFTGFLAGSYPALYLSGFNPAGVLKGKLSSSIGELLARKGLVVFQFTLSIILIVAVLVVYKQIEYIQNKNLGYNKNNIIYFDEEGAVHDKMENLLAELKRIPGVANASSIGQNIIGDGLNTISFLDWEGKKPDEKVIFEIRPVNYDMIEMLGIKMAEGRSFSRQFGTEDTKLIFNETAIKTMGLKDPIGKPIRIQGGKFEILGVVKDFHFASLHEKVNPLFFILRPDWTHKIMVKIEAGKEMATINKLQDFYQRYNPGFTFDFKFLDQDYQAQYVAEKRVSVLSRYFAGLAILISCLGLFGLAAYTAERRMKEIGIRKVLGSTRLNIVYLLSIEFTRMVAIAILIAFPVSYLLTRHWLNSFAFSIPLAPWYFIIAGVFALLTAWLTVGMQAYKAARINPIQCLREV